MDWRKLYFGPVGRDEVQRHIKDDEWQKVRLDMKGKPLAYKYASLLRWLKHNDYDRASQVQVTNYVTALSRGGLIKPADYLN